MVTVKTIFLIFLIGFKSKKRWMLSGLLCLMASSSLFAQTLSKTALKDEKTTNGRIEQILKQVAKEQQVENQNVSTKTNVTFKAQNKKNETQTKPKVILRLVGNIQIASNKMQIRDLANVQAKNAELKQKIEQFYIGNVPTAGNVIHLSKDEVLKRAKMGFPLADISITGASLIEISKKASKVTKDEQISIISKFESENSASDKFKLDIFTPLNDIFLVGKNLSYQASYLGNVPNSAFRNWKIDFFDGGKVIKKLIVKGKIVPKSEDQKITKTTNNTKNADLKNVMLDETKALSQKFKILLDESRPIKNEPSSQQKPKKISLANQKIIEKPLVNKGSLVNLNYQAKSFSLTTNAVALESGNLGDLIKVINENSRKMVTAKVTGKGEVKTFEINN